MKEKRITRDNASEVAAFTFGFLSGKKFAIAIIKREQGNIDFTLKPSQELKNLEREKSIDVEIIKDGDIVVLKISTSVECFQFPLFTENQKNPSVVFNDDSIVFSLINCLGRKEFFGFAPEL